MRIVVATSNPHKVEEIRAVFQACRGQDGGGPAVDLVSLRELGLNLPEPAETGRTFEANVRIKAIGYTTAAGLWTLADDSGLEVDCLGGEPGVDSAVYAGVTGPRAIVDAENNRLLLRRLGSTPRERRTARFVCTMALCRPPQPPHPAVEADVAVVVRGTVEGRMLGPGDAGYREDDPAANYRGLGEHGFGYDPLFFVPAYGCTMGQLPPATKNAISHRGQAARLMWAAIRQLQAARA